MPPGVGFEVACLAHSLRYEQGFNRLSKFCRALIQLRLDVVVYRY